MLYKKLTSIVNLTNVSDKNIPAEFREGFIIEKKERIYSNTRRSIFLCLFFWPLFGILDYIIYNDILFTMLEVRFFTCLIFVTLHLCSKKSLFKNNPKLLTISIYHTGNLSVCALICIAGGETSVYYAGISLIIIALIVGIPWEVYWVLLNSVIFWIEYCLFIILFDPEITQIDIFISNNYFIFATLFIGIFYLIGVSRITQKEFIARRMLSKEKQITEERLHDTEEQLIRTEKLAAVGTFASGVSHELRNPLSVIKNAVFLLKRKLSRKEIPDIDEKVVQFLDIMDKEIDRSSRIINDLLGFTRVTKPTRFSSDINEVVNESLSRVKIAENTKLSKSLSPNLPKVMIDANQIGQVLINLIENACQAMENGGELTVSTKATESLMEIEIGDSGCGIPEKEVKKIFDPLFTTKAKGTGIGLAVCHGIMQKHDGVINVKSQEGIGTKMFIKLPLEIKDAKPA